MALHFNSIRHELKYYDNVRLAETLKRLVKLDKLYRHIKSSKYQKFKTSIFSKKPLKNSEKHNYENALSGTTVSINHPKGHELENLTADSLRTVDKHVVRNFKIPADKRRDIDVISDNYIIEDKNYSRSQFVGVNDVKKFIKNLDLLSQTHNVREMHIYFIASYFCESAINYMKYETSYQIEFIELGFQVLSSSNRSDYQLFFESVNFEAPKSYSIQDNDAFKDDIKIGMFGSSKNLELYPQFLAILNRFIHHALWDKRSTYRLDLLNSHSYFLCGISPKLKQIILEDFG